MNKDDVRNMYAYYYNRFGFNYFKLKHNHVNYNSHFASFKLGSISNGMTPYEFRFELIKAIMFCVENGHYDIMSQDGQIHRKHELFFERLNDRNYKTYECLRTEGFFDEEDFLNWLDDTVKVTVKSQEIRESLVDDQNTSLYYEYNPVICGITVYIKIVFEKHFMTVDIHTNEENVVNAY